MLCDVCIETLGRSKALQEHDTKVNRQATSRQNREADENEQTEEGESTARTPVKISRDGVLTTLVSRGHHRTLSSFSIAVATGCHICEPFWVRCCTHDRIKKPDNVIASDVVGTVLNRIKGQAGSEEFLTYVKLTVKSQSLDSTLSLRFNEDLVDFKAVEYFQLMPGTRTEEVEEISLKSCTTHSTSSERSILLASHWLSNCLEWHDACNRDVSTVWYPTRLLFLGEHTVPGDTIYLVQTADHTPSGPYFTLSHRWGGTPFLQLSRSLLSAFHAGIAVANLPKTFQEAVFVTRSLGTCYLWIDSLCIMQDKDDLSDWYRESALMDKVYIHAMCNISATDAQDCSQGLFRDCNPHHINHVGVSLCLQDMNIDLDHLDCQLIDTNLHDRHVSRSAIGQRGWVLQERILAPRVLHFTSRQLFWECRSHEACERYPSGLPDGFQGTQFKYHHDYARDKDSSLTLAGPKVPEFGLGHDRWLHLVSRYTSMSLTNPNDKLVALSGIAKRRVAHTQDNYIAGMWRKNILRHLLWYTRKNVAIRDQNIQGRHTSYRAPTWSWASTDHPVEIFPRIAFDTCLYHVVDLHLTYATEDTTGPVTSGWIELRGYLKHTQLIWHEGGGDSNNLDEPCWHMMIDDESNLWHSWINLDNPPVNKKAFDGDNANGRLFYMPTAKISTVFNPDAGISLLFRVVDSSLGIFERLGYGYWSGVRDKQLQYTNAILADLGEEVKQSLPCVRYEDGLHTIRVI